MSRRERIAKKLLVEPGTDADLAGRDPAWTGGPEFEQLSAKQLGRTAKALLERGVKQLSRPRSCCGQPVMQAMVAAVLVDTIDSLELSWPEVSEQARAANAEARRKLAAEPDDKPG